MGSPEGGANIQGCEVVSGENDEKNDVQSTPTGKTTCSVNMHFLGVEGVSLLEGLVSNGSLRREIFHNFKQLGWTHRYIGYWSKDKPSGITVDFLQCPCVPLPKRSSIIMCILGTSSDSWLSRNPYIVGGSCYGASPPCESFLPAAWAHLRTHGYPGTLI